MKTTKRIMSLVLVLAMMMTLCISAYAKTDSEAIADPYGTAVVFSIQIGTKTVNFTWDEVNGKGAYKTFTAEYPAKVNGELSSSQWTGVSLSDLLAAAEKKLGLQLEDSYQIKGIAADGYESSFTVADVRDSEMRYMVAADPVSNGEYANSYVRILRGDDTFMPAQANLRCILSLEVLDENGKSLSTTPAKAPFTDTANYPWAEEAVNTLYNDGVITGVTATEFQPTAFIRRGDFMLMLVRAYGLEAEINGCFADVEEGAYYYNAIATAKALGIAKGDGENFNPRASITRQEAMTLLYRAAEAAGQDLSGFTADLSQYKDGNTVSSWAQAPIQALVGAGVINGKDGAIDPTGSMTRAELAVALYRAISLAK